MRTLERLAVMPYLWLCATLWLLEGLVRIAWKKVCHGLAR